jgi:predicted transcriptional regulator
MAPALRNEKGTAMEATNVKDEARHLVEELPDDASWEDLMYRIYVRQAIEAGLGDSEAGRTVDVKDVRAQFGLNP